MRYGRIEDLLRLCAMMQGRSDGISLAEIETAFNVSRRTAQRMRDALCRALPQVEEIRDDELHKRWRLPARSFDPIRMLSVEDMVALRRASTVLSRDGDQASARQIASLQERLAASLDASRRRRFDPDASALMQADGVAMRPGPRERVEPAVTQALQEAIKAGNLIEVDYRNRRAGKLLSALRIGPVGLLLGVGRQYLIGFQEGKTQARLFVLSGFSRVEVLAESFQPPEDFDIDAYTQRSFGIFQEEPFRVVWRFSGKSAKEAEMFLFHPTQTMEWRPDGSLDVSFVAGGSVEMCWHLFRWGAEVEIIEPDRLKREYEAMIRSVAETLDER